MLYVRTLEHSTLYIITFKKMQKDKVKEFYIQKDKFGYFHVVAVSENGDEFIIAGDICGGIPQISWHLLPKEQSNHE